MTDFTDEQLVKTLAEALVLPRPGLKVCLLDRTMMQVSTWRTFNDTCTAVWKTKHLLRGKGVGQTLDIPYYLIWDGEDHVQRNKLDYPMYFGMVTSISTITLSYTMQHGGRRWGYRNGKLGPI